MGQRLTIRLTKDLADTGFPIALAQDLGCELPLFGGRIVHSAGGGVGS